MGFQVRDIGSHVQQRIKSSSSGMFVFGLKMFTGFMLGLTLSLVGQEIVGYKTLSLVFLITVITGVFLRLSRNWGLAGILIFDLIAILFAMLLRMYILIAPGM
ncbi:MAG: hypothetical protein HOO06_13770 [Bdellovibrionaceae bacterium]|jgi:hypothetical protein|nr:hypothetical protein [Pseudobdellovibrionaceae bacterium]